MFGAAALTRHSVNILDVATALCSRYNSSIGCVNQHRVLSLMESLCRGASTCKVGNVVSALQIACNGLCTAARFHSAEENTGCLSGVLRWARLHSALQSLPHPCQILTFPLAWHRRMHITTAILNDLLFKIAVRSDRLCILVARLRDAFVTAYNLQRTNRGLGLHFREVLCGKMMTVMCFFQSDQLKPGAFWLPKPKKTLCYLLARLPPDYRVLSLPAGDSSQMEVLNAIPTGQRWPVGELNRLAGQLVRILCGPIACDPRHPAFLGATSCNNNTAELSGFAKAIRRANCLIPRRCSNTRHPCHDSKHALASFVTIGVAHQLKCNFHVSAHHVFGHSGNECADTATSLGIRGLISENNVPFFLPERFFF